MDVLSLIGILLAFIAILGGNFLEGGSLAVLANGPAALIVVGGTLAACLLQTPLQTLKRAVAVAHWVFFPPAIRLEEGVEKITRWSVVARKEGLLGLEPMAEREPDPYARKAMQLLADGVETENIRTILEVEMFTQEERDLQAAKVYEAMGGYSPTIGIIGAVLGLIQVMGNLTDPSQLGTGIAVAFIATIYGVAFANLFLLPLANKLKAVVRVQTRYRELLIEGVLSIAEGENPRSIEHKLRGFLV